MTADEITPDFVGRRVYIPAADHPHAGEWGVVIRQEPCALCDDKGWVACGHADLIVRLDSGEETRVYEPEAELE
jgi:hypothetical protein